MSYEVNLTENASEFINSIKDYKLKSKVFRTIDLLEEFGPILSMPHSKKIQSAESLFELRTQQGNNIVRLFYFIYQDKVYVITSGYVKKEQKVKKSEIDKAIEIMNQVKEGNI